MSKPIMDHHDPINVVDINSLKVSVNTSTSSCSSTITVSDFAGCSSTSTASCFSKWNADEFVEKRMEEEEEVEEEEEEEEEEEKENLELNKCEESSKTSFSSGSDSNGRSVNESSFRSYCSSKPHKGNDIRWDAIQSVMAKDGELGLGHFRLLKKLGFGDIGSVYLAELRGMGCLFAMKIMDKGMLAGRKKLVRTQTEREILGLLDHPFLPTLYSHFETEKFSCLLMEFCSGGDLHLLRQRQPGRHFSEQAARFYASEVLLALEYLHMMGVVYRDLKPENVLVREDGHIMLSDFDLSLRCCVNPTLVKSSNEQPSCTGSSSSSSSSSCITIDSSECRLPAVCVEPSCFQPSCFRPPSIFSSKSVKKPSSNSKSSNSSVSNSMVVSDSLPVLIAEPTGARSMSFVGTHEYLAPEIIRGDGHGSSVDWWTLGIFLYELLYGKTPFKGNGNRETLFNVVGQPLKFPSSSVASGGSSGGGDDDHHHQQQQKKKKKKKGSSSSSSSSSSFSVSYSAKDLIKSLLTKDPQKRLGYKRGATEIKQHPFFENVNWALIRGTQPPEIPKPVDLSFFNQKLNEKGTTTISTTSDSERSSGPYLEFEFF